MVAHDTMTSEAMSHKNKPTLMTFFAILVFATQMAQASSPVQEVGDTDSVDYACTILEQIAHPHLQDNAIYRHFKKRQAAKFHTTHDSHLFLINACHQLVLSTSISTNILEDALELLTKKALVALYIMTDCHDKGQITTDSAQLVRTLCFRKTVAPPSMTHSEMCFIQWLEGERALTQCYRKAFLGGIKPVPENQGIGDHHHSSCGYFDPKTFLLKLHKCSECFAFTHLEQEHLRRTTYAWLPAFFQESTRQALDAFCHNKTGPEVNFLQTLSLKAQKACAKRAQTIKSEATRKVVGEFLGEYAEPLAQTDRAFLEQKCHKVFEQAMLSPEDEAFETLFAFIRQLKTPIIISSIKASRLTAALLQINTEGASPLTEVSKSCDNHSVTFTDSTAKRRILDLLRSCKQQSFKKHQAISLLHTLCVTCKKLGELTQSADSPSADMTERRMTYYTERLYLLRDTPDIPKACIDVLWKTFEELKINVSKDQWETSKRILQKLPWIKNLTKKEQNLLLRFRVQEKLFTPPPFQTMRDYYDQNYSHFAVPYPYTRHQGIGLPT